MSAVAVHWTPLDGARTKILLGCVARVLADSNQTLDIVRAEEIMGQAQLRFLLESGAFDTEDGRSLLATRPHLADVDMDAMRALPLGTLGRTWVDFLDRHELSIELTRQPTPFTNDPDAAYVLHRIRQSHDLWHVLLGLGVRGHEEVLVHAFSLAQTGLPTSIFIVALGALKHMVGEGRWSALRHGLLAAHRRGKRAVPLVAVHWERHLERDLDEVRRAFRIEPMPA